MHFFKTLRTQSKRGLMLATAAFILMGIALSYDQSLLQWAWAHPNQPAKGHHAFRQTDVAFQTLSDFINRSPGERGEVDQFKGTFAKALQLKNDNLSNTPRSQRALGKVFSPEPAPIEVAGQGPIDSLTSPLAIAAVPLGLLPPDQTSGGSTALGTAPNAIPGSVIFGPNGASSPGGGGLPPSQPPVGAVPEPSTWALLLVGFFSTGLSLRKSRAKIHRRREMSGS